LKSNRDEGRLRETRELFFKPSVIIEDFGISERLTILYSSAVEDVTHRQFDDLSALRARNIGDFED